MMCVVVTYVLPCSERRSEATEVIVVLDEPAGAGRVCSPLLCAGGTCKRRTWRRCRAARQRPRRAGAAARSAPAAAGSSHRAPTSSHSTASGGASPRHRRA
eukprot:5574214-Prymnesium_polylepis.1